MSGERAGGERGNSERLRLDLWLFHARVVRTRSNAADLIRAGHVRLNGARVTAPGQVVRLEDVLTVSLNAGVRILRVISFIERRGDAKAAQTTYLDITPGTAPDSHAS
ncbi:MAG TPA: RNA-binding S4 domain-containing protein [Ancylobacter sp.]